MPKSDYFYTAKHRDWIRKPWTCPHCHKAIKQGGAGTHERYCLEDKTARFWEKVMPIPWTGCWIWMGAQHFRGYGACGNVYGDTRAHRVSWKLTHGDIPEGLGVLHKCDNPICVNPEHLYLGDQAQNNADRKSRSRGGHKFSPVEDLLHPHLSARFGRYAKPVTPPTDF